jgi:hypothetical protein
MKKTIVTLVSLFIVTVLMAQTPEKVNYQAVARDLSGTPLSNTDVNLTFEILRGSESGVLVFSESQTIRTNQFGLFTAEIGAINTTDFPSIAWGANTYFLRISVNGDVMPATQLLSVPYALHAKTASSGVPGADGIDCWDTNANGIDDLNEDINGDLAFNALDCKGNAGLTGPTGTNGADGTNGLGVQWLGTFASPPSTPNNNDAYYNSALGQSLIWGGVTWTIMAQDGVSVNYSSGTGIDLAGDVVTNTSPDQTVAITGAGGATVTGTYPNFTVTTTDAVNDADASISNETITAVGLSGSTLTITEAGSAHPVDLSSIQGTTYSSGTGIDLTGNTVTNTSPDQTVAITGAGGATVTGTYPNFTVTTTDAVNDADASTTNETITGVGLSGSTLTITEAGSANTVDLSALQGTTYSSGTGIDLTGDVVTNTSPDQTVAITGAGGATVTGTYPNFTVTTTDNVNDADASISNETITAVGLSGSTLTITEAGSAHPVDLSSIQGTTYSSGTGIDLAGDVVTNTSPDQTVAITGGGGATVTGTYPNFTVTTTDAVNDADASISNETITAVGLSGSTLTITEAGSANTVDLSSIQGTTYSSGTGIDLAGDVVTNTSPDQTVAITGGGGATVTGTYPNFTVTTTDNVNDADASISNETITAVGLSGSTLTITEAGSANTVDLSSIQGTTYSSGTGIDLTGDVVTNTSPDLTVAITGAGGATVTGTYPIFTVTNTLPDQTVILTGTGGTNVTGTYPNFTVNSTDNVNDADADVTNELITNFGLNGTNDSLVIDEAGNLHVVALSDLAGSNAWTKGTGNDIYNNTDNVGIGTIDPKSPLQLGNYMHLYPLTMGLNDYSVSTYNAYWDGTTLRNTIAGSSGFSFLGHESGTPMFGIQLFPSQLADGNIMSGSPDLTMKLKDKGLGINVEEPLSALDLQSFESSVIMLRHPIDNTPGTINYTAGDGNILGLSVPMALSGGSYNLTYPSMLPSTAGSSLVSDLSGNLSWSVPAVSTSLWTRPTAAIIHLTNLGDMVGIGTSTPLSLFHIASDLHGVATIQTSSSAGQGGTLQLQRSTGDVVSPTSIVSGDELGRIEFKGHSGVGSFESGAIIIASADEGFGASASGSHLEFLVSPLTSGAPVEAMRIHNNGNVGIGITIPTTRLHINGGHLRHEGAQPTGTLAGSTDMRGAVDVNFSATGSISVSFTESFTIVPTVIITPVCNSDPSVNARYWLSNVSLTGFTVNWSNTSFTPSINYMVIE